MKRSTMFFGAAVIAVAMASGAVARGIVNDRGDFVRAFSSTNLSDQQKWDSFYALRNACDRSSGDSVRNAWLGNGTTADINHTCNRYTTCDGNVSSAHGPSFRFILDCR